MTPVAVYLPTRDRCELLQRAIGSVLAQTHREFELIVVDDGSRDGTAAYLDRLAAAEPRLRVIRHDAPRGAPQARNAALRAADAEWITGLDDDDEFMPGRLAALLALTGAFDAAGVAFSALYTQDEVVRGRAVPPRITTKPCCAQLDALFAQNCVGNQLFMRRRDVLDVGLYDEALPAWQDLDLAMRMVGRFGPARLLDRPLYRLHHDERPDRISRQRKEAIVAAFAGIAAKWPDASATSKQRLYLQVLGEHYGFPVERADIRRYLSFGIQPDALLKLLRRCVQRRA